MRRWWMSRDERDESAERKREMRPLPTAAAACPLVKLETQRDSPPFGKDEDVEVGSGPPGAVNVADAHTCDMKRGLSNIISRNEKYKKEIQNVSSRFIGNIWITWRLLKIEKENYKNGN